MGAGIRVASVMARAAMLAAIGGCALQPPREKIVDPMIAYGSAPDPAVACELLRASQCAYSIGRSGELMAGDDANSCSAKWIAARGMADGGDSLNAVLLALAPGSVIVAYRGTLAPSSDRHDAKRVIRDWLLDLRAEAATDPPLAGELHSGFLAALHATSDRVVAVLDEWRGAGLLAGKPLYVAGHSKGGAVASIAALELDRAGFTPAAVYTFAAPRAGDAPFVDAIGAKRFASWHYENRYDVVPHLPPNSGDGRFVEKAFEDRFSVPHDLYRSAGKLLFIDWRGRITADYEGLLDERIDAFNERLDEPEAGDAVIAAHSSKRGAQYDTAVCGKAAP